VTRRAYCTFRVGELLLGIEVERVQEVIHGPKVTSVPLADESVLGLVNLRGQIVTAIDARRRLRLNDRDAGERSAHVIVRCHSEPVSLVVDSEDEVVEVEAQAADEVPETVGSAIRDLLTGIHQVNDRLLLVLDADRTLSPASTEDWR
jgi:purine-binding chemotaxis protein CheW